ncbi:MAG: polymer-forming cytoskeletal protein [Candidatus Lambdaproteobacteria bacterium]|nr:polymer-forming cytoskeletal protein [Candidatus Lambdaproteobacteria bacterium]
MTLKSHKTTSFIGEGSEFEGTLVVKGGVRIDGRLKGDLKSESVVYLGDAASIEGDVTAEAVISSGRIEGDIDAAQLVQVHLPGALKGAVRTREIVLEKGVYFDGSCKMTTSHD